MIPILESGLKFTFYSGLVRGVNYSFEGRTEFGIFWTYGDFLGNFWEF